MILGSTLLSIKFIALIDKTKSWASFATWNHILSSKSTIQPTRGASSCHFKSLTYSWGRWEGAKHKVSESLLKKTKDKINKKLKKRKTNENKTNSFNSQVKNFKQNSNKVEALIKL